MKTRFAQKRPLLDTLTRFWATNRGLSIFSTLLLVAIFVLPPLQAPGAGRTFVADAVFALLLIAGVRALSERRLTLLLLTPVAAVTGRGSFRELGGADR